MIDRLAVIGLTLLFVVALLLPADNSNRGYQMVCYSPLVLFFPPWHANTLLAIGGFSLWFHQRQFAGLCGFAAAMLAVWVLPIRKSGDSLFSAYHVWFITCLAMGFAGFVLHSVYTKKKDTQPQK